MQHQIDAKSLRELNELGWSNGSRILKKEVSGIRHCRALRTAWAWPHDTCCAGPRPSCRSHRAFVRTRPGWSCSPPEEVAPLFFAVHDDKLPLAQMVVGRRFQACVNDPLNDAHSTCLSSKCGWSSSLIASYTSILPPSFEFLEMYDGLYAGNRTPVCHISFAWNGFFFQGGSPEGCGFDNFKAVRKGRR